MRPAVLGLAALLVLAVVTTADAQSPVTLDATSGSNTIPTSYSTTGGLTINLGFFADVLVVGGGGGGGNANGAVAGGGGAGQVLVGSGTALTAQNYSVTVGAGGAGGIGTGTLEQTVGTVGGTSTFTGTGLSLIAAGGGGGGGSLGFGATAPLVANASNGASGGGGSAQASATVLGAPAPGTAGQGSAGGAARGDAGTASGQAGGGGGGANAAGVAGTSGAGGAGGGGVSNSITGTTKFYGGGGGGGKRSSGTAGAGGQGGGGAGGLSAAGAAGTPNTGGGGGGGGETGIGGQGGSGLVVVRYQGTSVGNVGGAVSPGTGSAAGYTLHTFTDVGSSSFDLSGVNMNTRLGATLTGTLTGSGGFVFAGPGTLTLTGSNTYSGGTTVSAGRLVGSTSSLRGAIDNAAQLEFAQTSAGTFPSVISGTGSVMKSGAGNLILSDTSTYIGATTVAAGRLSVNGGLGNTAVTVQNGAELGGSGRITGPVLVAAGGTLAPGNSIESLGAGATTFSGTSTFAFEVDSSAPLSAGADLLTVSGSLSILPGALVTFVDLAGAPQAFGFGTSFAMISYSGTWNGGFFTYGATTLADGATFTVGSQQWEIDYNRTSSAGLANFSGDYLPGGSFVAITAVPEPATWALAVTGLACGGLSMWRRRKRA